MKDTTTKDDFGTSAFLQWRGGIDFGS